MKENDAIATKRNLEVLERKPPRIQVKDYDAIIVRRNSTIPLGKALTIIAMVAIALIASIYMYSGDLGKSLNNILNPTLRQQPQRLLQQDIADLTKAVSANPDDPQAYVELGWAYFTGGNGDMAQQAYQEALSLEPNYIPALLNMGILLAEKRQYEEAKANLTKVIKIDPGHELARFNLGVIAIKNRKYNTAIDHFNHAIKANPTSGDAWYYLGMAYEGNKKNKLALSAYKKAVNFLPGNSDIKTALARLKNNGSGGSAKR